MDRMETSPSSIGSESIVIAPAATTLVFTWRHALTLFLRSLESDHTRATYRRAVRAFFETPGAPDLDGLTPALLGQYRAALCVRCGLVSDQDAGETALTAAFVAPSRRQDRIAPATAQIRLAALRSFLVWLYREQGEWAAPWLPATLDTDTIHYRLRSLRAVTVRPYEVLETADEQRAVLDVARVQDVQPERALALVALCLGGGLRIAEACAVRLGDVGRDAAGVYVRVQGKGHKERLARISDGVYQTLVRYAATSGRVLGGRGREGAREASEPLFLSYKRGAASGTALKPGQARRIVKRVTKEAGALAPTLADKRITPHALRHSFAIDALRGNPAEGRPPASVAAVSKLLGHANIEITSRYLDHLTQAELSQFAPSLGLGGLSSER